MTLGSHSCEELFASLYQDDPRLRIYGNDCGEKQSWTRKGDEYNKDDLPRQADAKISWMKNASPHLQPLASQPNEQSTPPHTRPDIRKIYESQDHIISIMSKSSPTVSRTIAIVVTRLRLTRLRTSMISQR